MHTSLNLYAEHEFNASTFAARVIAGTGSDMYSAITGGIGALRGPKHGGANEVALDIQNRYESPDAAEADIRARIERKEVVIENDIGWRVAFIAGLLGAPLIYRIFTELPAIQIDANNGILIAAGLIVGVGTRYGSGCTSGHGVCGLSRLSPRSLVATLTFMTAGFAATYVVRHIIN